MHKVSISCQISLHAIAAAVLATPLAAQDVTEEPRPDDIVVTARKKEEAIQDIPLSIRAFTEQAIEREGIRRIDDVARRTPGLTFDIGGFPNDTRPALRGMQAERGRPSVAVLLDGQDLSGENISIAGGTGSLNTALFDIERIEVVKGPQSTLYGRNAFAGAINYVSRDPGFTLGGKVGMEAGNGGLIQGQGAANIPIVDDVFAIRVNGSARQLDGYYRNPQNRGRLGAERSQGASIAALFRPTPSVRIVGRYMYSRDRVSEAPNAFLGSNVRLPAPGATYAVSPAPGSPTLPCPAALTGLTAAQVTSCTRGTLVGAIRAREIGVQTGTNPITNRPFYGMKMQQDVASLDASWDSGVGTFSYRLGYLRNRTAIEQDGDFTSPQRVPAPPGTVLSVESIQRLGYGNKHWDHELRYAGTFGAVDITVGGQYFDEKSDNTTLSQFYLRNPASPLAGPPFNLASAPLAAPTFGVLTTRDTRYWAVYGGLGWQVTSRLKVSAEARYNDDRIVYRIPGFRRQDVSLSRLTPVCLPQFVNGATFAPANPAGSPPPGTVVACPRAQTLRFDQITPRGTVEYKPNDDALLYATVAKGFKPGGINTNEIVDLVGQAYAPETVVAYELGAKTEWFDRRLTVNLAGYYNDYTDQQIGVQLTTPGAGGQPVTGGGIVNAGKVRIYGIEAEADLRATDKLRLFVGYAYTRAKFKTYVQGPPPGSAAAAFAACGVPVGQTSSDQNRAEAGNICGDFSDRTVGKSPKHALNLSAEWRQPYGEGDAWFVQADALYRSRRFTDESNLVVLPAYWRANVRAGIEFDGFSVIGYVDNVFDNRRIETAQRNVDFARPEGFAPGRGFIAYLPRPRTYGLRTLFQF